VQDLGLRLQQAEEERQRLNQENIKKIDRLHALHQQEIAQAVRACNRGGRAAR
jgi:hypothetical protein